VGRLGGIFVGILGGLLVDETDVFRGRTEVFVGRIMKGELVESGEPVPVAVGVSCGLTGRRGMSAM
jgi:hypothetical protein